MEEILLLFFKTDKKWFTVYIYDCSVSLYDGFIATVTFSSHRIVVLNVKL
jgi:hypothetical protein